MIFYENAYLSAAQQQNENKFGPGSIVRKTSVYANPKPI
jgi:hypothetical protein